MVSIKLAVYIIRSIKPITCTGIVLRSNANSVTLIPHCEGRFGIMDDIHTSCCLTNKGSVNFYCTTVIANFSFKHKKLLFVVAYKKRDLQFSRSRSVLRKMGQAVIILSHTSMLLLINSVYQVKCFILKERMW